MRPTINFLPIVANGGETPSLTRDVGTQDAIAPTCPALPCRATIVAAPLQAGPALITFDPDDVTQDASIMLVDGRRIAIDALDEAELVAAARQLWLLRSAYAEAFVAAHPGRASDVIDEKDLEQLAPLHRAIARRQKDLAAGGGRQPGSVPAEDLFQTATWTSRDGTSRAVTLLSPAHRRSLVAWLERNATALADRIDPQRDRLPHLDPLDWVRATPVHQKLTELIAQQSGFDEAKDRARQISRQLHFEATGTWPDEGPVRPSTR